MEKIDLEVLRFNAGGNRPQMHIYRELFIHVKLYLLIGIITLGVLQGINYIYSNWDKDAKISPDKSNT